ncbi:MAG: hypothetical protein ACKVOJ_12275 [Sphingomonadaceae bacterium]
MAVSSETFDMGRIFSRMATSVIDHWKVIVAFSAAAGVIRSVSTSLALGPLLSPDLATNPAAALALFGSSGYWISIIVSLLVSSFAQTAILAALYQGHESGDVSFGDAVTAAIARFIPYVLMYILWIIAISIGFGLLVIPGLFLVTIWAVCAPALAGEGLGLFEAFGRSQALTKGHRWWVLLTLIIFGLVYFFVSFAAQGFSTTGMLALYQSSFVAAIVVGVIAQTVQLTILMSFLNALYFELRLVNEGSSTSALKDIFA